MITVLLVLHLFVTLALIGVILIQRSEGGGLGIGSSQGMGAFMGGRSTANLLTRTTAVLATLFMALALTLAILNRGASRVHSILDLPASAPVPASPLPAAPLPASPPPASPLPANPSGSSAPANPAPANPASAAPGTAPQAPAAPQVPAAPLAPAAPPSAPSSAPASSAPAAPSRPAPPVPTN
jgi:preprotein translocase subunit SecG